jgi:hypothetical protein
MCETWVSESNSACGWTCSPIEEKRKTQNPKLKTKLKKCKKLKKWTSTLARCILLKDGEEYVPHISAFEKVKVTAVVVVHVVSSSDFHNTIGLATLWLYPLVHVTVICR